MSLLRLVRRCEHSFVGNVLAPGAVVDDLGLNTGDFAIWIAERFGCAVYGAEPDPDLRNRSPQRADVKVFACAIGGRSEPIVLKRAPGECPTLLAGSFEPENELEVEVLSLEEFLSRAGLAGRDRIDLVKVDIEGAELAMFEEAPDALLQRVAQFTVEFHDFIWPELTNRVNRVRSHLRSLGFQAINFSLDNTDVLFLNRKLLGIGAAGDAYLRAVKYAMGIRRRAGRLLPAARTFQSA